MIKSVKVGGQVYSVEKRTGVFMDNGERVAGNIDVDAAEIKVWDKFTGTASERVLMHEVTHAVFYEAGYGLEDQDEQQIERVSRVLHQLIKDNQLFEEGEA